MPELTLAARTRRAPVPAIEVKFPDGQVWGFATPAPHPWPLLRREIDAFGRDRLRIEQETRVGYPLAVRRLKAALRNSSRDDANGPSSDLFRRLATALLRIAHDVDQAEAESILDPRDVDFARIARRIIPAVFGGPGEPYPL